MAKHLTPRLGNEVLIPREGWFKVVAVDETAFSQTMVVVESDRPGYVRYLPQGDPMEVR